MQKKYSISIFLIAIISGSTLYGWAFRWCGPQGSGLYYGYYDHAGNLHCNDPKDPNCVLACQRDSMLCEALQPGRREYRLDSENAPGPYVITLQDINKTISKKFLINAHDDVYISPCPNTAEGFAFYTGHKPECNAESDDCNSTCFANAKNIPYGPYQYCKTMSKK